MADAVASQTLLNGPRNCVMKFTNLSDGTGESAVTKVDVSALGYSRVRIDKIHYTCSGMTVRLLWDATADVPIFELGPDKTSTLDFTHFGGLRNNAGDGVTGDINFTTVGHSSGDSYSIILEMVGTPA
jgi:hypothetical protein